jgi:hypothetical protein
MNQEQVLSFVRWLQATIGPLLIANGYVSASTLQMVSGVVISLVPLAWSMFVHTQTNAVAVVAALAKDPASPVKAIVTDPSLAGRELAKAMPSSTTFVAGTQAAETAAKS